jgi:hypothetical protein
MAYVREADRLKTTSPETKEIEQNATQNMEEDIEKESIVENSPNGEYIIFVDNNFLASGTKESMIEQIEMLIYGQHPDFEGVQVLQETIKVLKNIEIKIGIFLD